MQRRSLLRWTAGLGALAAGSIEAAGPSGPVKRLAVLLLDRRELWASFATALTAELAALGWVDARNLAVQWRYADGDRALLRSHAEELVRSTPDAILTRGTPARLSGIISATPSITWSRRNTVVPKLMRSATERPSRAPSRIAAVMSAVASG